MQTKLAGLIVISLLVGFPPAYAAARWFEAIDRQSPEKAWAFHDRLYDVPDLVKQGETAIDSLVSSLGLDAEQVRRDFVSEEVTAQVQHDRTEAMSFGFQGTPAFLINDVSLRGAYPIDEFVQVIDMGGFETIRLDRPQGTRNSLPTPTASSSQRTSSPIVTTYGTTALANQKP